MKSLGVYFISNAENSHSRKNWCHQMSDFKARMHQIRFPCTYVPVGYGRGVYSSPLTL